MGSREQGAGVGGRRQEAGDRLSYMKPSVTKCFFFPIPFELVFIVPMISR